jgi:hypothetical protein
VSVAYIISSTILSRPSLASPSLGPNPNNESDVFPVGAKYENQGALYIHLPDWSLTADELGKCIYNAPWFSYFAPTGKTSDSLLGFGPSEGEAREGLDKIVENII